MRYKLTKQALKTLVKLEKSDKKTGERIAKKIVQRSRGEISGEAIKGSTDYEKIRVGKYRIISTVKDDVLWVFIIEKRETVYDTFAHLMKNSDLLN